MPVSDGEALELLRRIESHLAVLTMPVRNAALNAFTDEVLRTDARKRMFELMDGNRTVQDIARSTGTTGQAVRDLVRSLEPRGFVSARVVGTAQAPFGNGDAIVRWHLEEQLKSR